MKSYEELTLDEKEYLRNFIKIWTKNMIDDGKVCYATQLIYNEVWKINN